MKQIKSLVIVFASILISLSAYSQKKVTVFGKISNLGDYTHIYLDNILTDSEITYGEISKKGKSGS